MKTIKTLTLASVLVFGVVVPVFATPPSIPCRTPGLSQQEKIEILKSFQEKKEYSFLKEWGSIPKINDCYGIYVSADLKTPKNLSKYSVTYDTTFGVTLNNDGSVMSANELIFSSSENIQSNITFFEQQDIVKDFLENFPVYSGVLNKFSISLVSDKCFNCGASINLRYKDGVLQRINYHLPSGVEYQHFLEMNKAVKAFNEFNFPDGCRIDKEKPYYVSHEGGQYLDNSREFFISDVSYEHNSKCPYSKWRVYINKDGTPFVYKVEPTSNKDSTKKISSDILMIFSSWIKSIFK